MPTAPAADEPRTFLATLASLEDGQLAQDLTDDERKLMLSLLMHAEKFGKAKGEINIKMKFSVDGQSSTAQIDTEVTVKEPKKLRARTMKWMTKDGHLSGTNPKQMHLGLREVGRAPEPKEAVAKVAE